MSTAESILAFWFGEVDDVSVIAQQKSSLWWGKNSSDDLEIKRRFESDVHKAASGELDEWAGSGRSLLALILLTDQFPRSMYRNSPGAFAYDAFAQRWSLHGIANGMDVHLRPIERVFFYLPLEHSESRELQEQSVALYSSLVQLVPESQQELFNGFLRYAIRHRDIIDRFGRFPHRNAILGRRSTDQEIQFLREPGSRF